MGKVLIFFADGLEEIEGLTVVDLLRRVDIPVDIVSITGQKSITGSHNIRIEADCLFDEADFGGADMLVLPGGMPGTKNLEAFAPLMDKLDEFRKDYNDGKDKYVAAICAAPSIFAHRGYLKGIKACCHPSMESHLTEGGAILNPVPVNNENGIITSRGMGTAIDFGLEIVSLYKGADCANTLSKGVVH